MDEVVVNNPIRQLATRATMLDGDLAPVRRGQQKGLRFKPSSSSGDILIATSRSFFNKDDQRALLIDSISGENNDFTSGSWIQHPLYRKEALNFDEVILAVQESWKGAFSYVEENEELGISGLRSPQIGAVHAVHAHWSTSNKPATIVMPTGTGKTDTMIAILVSELCTKLLVVVPTDPLRSQIVDKFLSLGVLRLPAMKILDPDAQYPVVATLRHIPKTVAEVDQILSKAQVIVTTSSIAGRCSSEVQTRFASHCPYLFIDEAHHAEAPTWRAFKSKFSDRRVLQFTATPFREDGRHLDGEIIYNYPLRRAQKEGYFKTIKFSSVSEFSPSRVDEAITKKAIKELRSDADKGHILMARVSSVKRAEEVFKLYAPYSDFNPVQLHTGIKSLRKRKLIRQKILTGESRIVVCVDMLGEGFDLPELKIAAFHDIRKTLAVTLQLAGRFTRARLDLGDPVFIANIADVDVREELRQLYSREPDWNTLLPELSEKLVSEQVDFQAFLEGFDELPKELPLRSVRPATSAVVYQTQENWRPEDFKKGIPFSSSCDKVLSSINYEQNTLIVVTVRRVSLAWIEATDLSSWEWELYVLVWLPEEQLLFINSSANRGSYKALAHAVCGDDASPIKGQDVFRTFSGVHRLRLQNVGLTEQLGRNIRYTGRMGSDVGSALPGVQRQRAVKAVLSGTGFEGGRRVTVAASRKGRIWSHSRGNVMDLARWCKHMGRKLLDESIDPDAILRGTLEAKTVVSRPEAMPITIDWPEDFYKTSEIAWTIVFPGGEKPLAEVGIELVEPNLDGALAFVVTSENEEIEFELVLSGTDSSPTYKFVSRKSETIHIKKGGYRESVDGREFFYDNPPIIWFADGASLEGNQYVPLKVTHPPFDPQKIEPWNWTKTNIRCESQGIEKDPSSIQARVIKKLRKKGYLVIVDDDGTGEAADVVAIKAVGDKDSPEALAVEFYHCKASTAAQPGARVRDLYEVCGQAQKSISWMASDDRQTDIFRHLLHRNEIRLAKKQPSRIEEGDKEELTRLREISRLRPVNLSIYIVQPGLSKAAASPAQLRLLGVTENYLMETYQVPFGVIASAGHAIP